jgi:Phage capsid family
MTLAERIQAAQAALTAARDLLVAKSKELTDTPEDDALVAEVDALSTDIEAKEKSLAALMRAEATIAKAAAPAGGLGHNGGPTLIPPRQAEFKPSADLFIRGAVCALQAFYERRSALEIAAERYKDDEVSAYMVALTTKAAQAPATTFTPGYAAELVRQTYAAWMDSLKTVAVLPRLPLRSENFDDGAPIVFPMRGASAAFPLDFEAMWRKEGDPIRVGVLSLTSATMRPYSAGVIGHFTKELLKRSNPNIESVIREAILDDTGKAMDAYFFSNSAPVVDVRPPGIANGIAAGDTRAQSGTTAAAVRTDLMSMVNTLMVTRGLGRSPVWAMHSINASALGALQTPLTGAPVYPGMGSITGGTLMGFPVFAGLAMPTSRIYLIDAAYVAFAGGTPLWEVSDQATIHEETQTPLPIGSTGTPAVVAAPVRSLFQTHSAAVKAVYELSWLILRAGAVQELTGVTWGAGGITASLELPSNQPAGPPAE